ncbi:MAG TPA: PAS domain S-box protein [Lentisphaerae bacterium]|nr:PAS domain S-box protein [Lentisphaerota bacterium]
MQMKSRPDGAVDDEESFRSTMRIDITPEVLRKLGQTQESNARSLRRRPRVVSGAGRRRVTAEGTGGLRELLDSIYDGVLLCSLDGVIQEANVRAVEFLLYGRDELVGRSILSIFAGADEDLLASVREAVTSERFVVIQAYCQRKDGTYFPAEIAVNLLRVNRDRLCFFIRDVTVRKETEDRLRAITIAVENAASGILIAGLDGRISYANPALVHLCGYHSSDDLRGQPLQMLFQDDDTVRAMMEQVVKGGKEWRGETTIRGADKVVNVEVTAAANRDSDGEMIGIVLSIMDISDRKRMEEARREAAEQRAMIASIGAACHHLGQPATVIVTNLELLKRYYQRVPGEVQEILDSCMEAATTFGDILRRLNAATRFETEEYIARQGASKANEILKI